MVLRTVALSLLIIGYVNTAMAWNALGHKLVAQIAINELSSEKILKLNHLNHGLDGKHSRKVWNALGQTLAPQLAMNDLSNKKIRGFVRSNYFLHSASPSVSLVNSAIWLDVIRRYDDSLDIFHYIDFPFSKQKLKLPAVADNNAIIAINRSIEILNNNKASRFDKGFCLRVLLHVVGDIHQPMHSVSQITIQHQKGDLGGNLYPLQKNDISNNLHGYWDKGGGMLSSDYPITSGQLKTLAQKIHTRWPCTGLAEITEPQIWAKESHTLAKNISYSIEKNTQPSKKYSKQVQNIAQQRIALAGCRLAKILQTLNL